MSEAEFLAILKSVLTKTDVATLDVPVEKGPLDSLDLLTLRSALETRLDRTISDDVWLKARTFRELLAVL